MSAAVLARTIAGRGVEVSAGRWPPLVFVPFETVSRRPVKGAFVEAVREIDQVRVRQIERPCRRLCSAARETQKHRHQGCEASHGEHYALPRCYFPMSGDQPTADPMQMYAMALPLIPQVRS